MNSRDLGHYDLKMVEASVASVQNKKTSITCKVDYGNLAASFRMGTTDHLVFEIASGSSRQVVVYDAKECKELMMSEIDPSGGTQVTADRIFSPAFCDCDTEKK